MEELASLLLAADPSGSAGDLVASVYDQFLDFLVPSPSLFSLLPKRIPAPAPAEVVKTKKPQPEKEIEAPPSYAILNDPRATEHDVEEEAERISRGLFSVIVTMGNVPIIRCPRGNAAEMVARKLDAKLRDWITSGVGGRGHGDGLGGLQRPRESGTRRVECVTYPNSAMKSPRHTGSECGSNSHDFTFMDIPGSGTRRLGYEAQSRNCGGTFVADFYQSSGITPRPSAVT
jgi:hypothetical protein